jgi:hypothetical protein
MVDSSFLTLERAARRARRWSHEADLTPGMRWDRLRGGRREVSGGQCESGEEASMGAERVNRGDDGASRGTMDDLAGMREKDGKRGEEETGRTW